MYLFQSLPVPIPTKEFVEWDKMMSKYIWKGKKARVKYKTLQLNKGSCGLPCLREYFCAAQLRPLICLCFLDYTAGWKDVEGETIKTIPIKAIIADSKLWSEINLADETISQVKLSACNEANRTCGLENASKVLRWCAYDSEFILNKHDERFKKGISKGLTSTILLSIWVCSNVLRPWKENMIYAQITFSDIYRSGIIWIKI